MEEEKAASGATRPRGRILMATVKGDVHDIGKNIVGVVLQCNNYEVIDLGVMVPCDTHPGDGAAEEVRPDRPERPDHAVARGDDALWPTEMQRQGFTLPLLIGGATTSRLHTALRIAPPYRGPVVHVLDASRAVGVVGSLLSETLRDDFVHKVSGEYRALREAREGDQRSARRLTLAEARSRRTVLEWPARPPRRRRHRPAHPG